MSGGQIEMLRAHQASSLTREEVASRLGTETENGLRERDVDERRRNYGDNELKPPPPTPLYMRYLAQFKV